MKDLNQFIFPEIREEKERITSSYHRKLKTLELALYGWMLVEVGLVVIFLYLGIYKNFHNVYNWGAYLLLCGCILFILESWAQNIYKSILNTLTYNFEMKLVKLYDEYVKRLEEIKSLNTTELEKALKNFTSYDEEE